MKINAFYQRQSYKKYLPWLVWAIGSAFVALQMMIQTSPSIMIDGLEKSFAIDTFHVSLLSSSFFYSYILLQIPAGILLDRVAPRDCLIICLLFITGLSMLFATAHSLFVLTSARVLQGVFCAPAVVATLYLAANWFPQKYFALLAGLTEMAGMLGAAIGQAGLAPIVHAWGWRSSVWLTTVLCCILAILTASIIHNNPNASVEVRHKNDNKNIIEDLLTIITYSQSWINGCYTGIYFAICSAFAAFWCIPFLRQIYHLSLTLAATASSTILLGLAVGAPLIGWYSDNIQQRRLPMIVCSCVVFILMLIILYASLPLFPLIIALFLLGVFSGVYALPFAVMRDIMPCHVRASAMGYTNMMCILLGAPILQPLIGWMLNHAMSHTVNIISAYRQAFSLFPLLLGIGIVLAFMMKETNCGLSKAL